ncbi:hypothetical protein M3J09_009248 [Ascochyta lentis]
MTSRLFHHCSPANTIIVSSNFSHRLDTTSRPFPTQPNPNQTAIYSIAPSNLQTTTHCQQNLLHTVPPSFSHHPTKRHYHLTKRHYHLTKRHYHLTKRHYYLTNRHTKLCNKKKI